MEKVNLTVRLDKDLKEAVEAACKNNDVTVSQLVRSSFRKFLNDVQERDAMRGKPVDVQKVDGQKAVMSAFVRGPGAQKGGKKRR